MKNEIDTVARVCELAEARHMTVSHLARICGINPSTFSVSRTRGGQLKIDTIIRICDTLDLTLSEFFAPGVPAEPRLCGSESAV